MAGFRGDADFLGEPSVTVHDDGDMGRDRFLFDALDELGVTE
jgi:hypothetical protein